MKKILVFILILLPKVKNQSFLNNHLNIKTGTTIIIFVDNDSTILCSDSRLSLLNQGYFSVAPKISDNKIFNKGKVFFACAGSENLGNKKINDIIKENYNDKKSVEENSSIINTVLKNEYQTFIDNLSFLDKANVINLGLYKVGSTIFIFSYENKIPVLCELEINLKLIDNKIIVMPDTPSLSYDKMRFKFGGLYSNIWDTLHSGNYSFDNNRLNHIINLICYEAHYNNAVDSNVNYYIIKPTYFKRGKNY